MAPRYPIIESLGYMVSILSTFLLGIVAWEGSHGNARMRFLIFAGALLAVLGMIARWYVWWRRHVHWKHDR